MESISNIVAQRFEEKYIPEPNTGCWLWIGQIMQNGYSRMYVGSADHSSLHKLGHIVSFLLYKGSIPKGLEIDHLCRIRHCVNPTHLEAVTHRRNMERAYFAIQTHCFRGHKYTTENTRHYKHKNKNRRVCRKCGTINSRIWREKQQ